MNKYNALVNLNIALPDLVNKNQILSERMLQQFIQDVQNLCSKYNFDSMAIDTELEIVNDDMPFPNVENYVEYEPFSLDELRLAPDYSKTTLKEIDDVIKKCSGDEICPAQLMYNLTYNTLKLLNEDIDNYTNVYEEYFPAELMDRIVDIQLMITTLMNSLL